MLFFHLLSKNKTSAFRLKIKIIYHDRFHSIVLTIITATQNEAPLSYHSVRDTRAIFSGSYFRSDYNNEGIRISSNDKGILILLSLLINMTKQNKSMWDVQQKC